MQRPSGNGSEMTAPPQVALSPDEDNLVDTDEDEDEDEGFIVNDGDTVSVETEEEEDEFEDALTDGEEDQCKGKSKTQDQDQDQPLHLIDFESIKAAPSKKDDRVPKNFVYCNREHKWFHRDSFSAAELKKDFPQSLKQSCHYYITKTGRAKTTNYVREALRGHEKGDKVWAGYNTKAEHTFYEVSEACPFKDSNPIRYDDKKSGVKRLAFKLEHIEKKY
jgi:hypothetical protein